MGERDKKSTIKRNNMRINSNTSWNEFLEFALRENFQSIFDLYHLCKVLVHLLWVGRERERVERLGINIRFEQMLWLFFKRLEER